MFFFETARTKYHVETENTETRPDESELVGLAQRGDEDAFVELAKRYRPKVWSTASRFARSRAELEDLTQDLFLKIWKGIPGYRADSPFENWLMTVTVRGCYDFLRKHRRRRETETLVDPQESREARDETTERDQNRRDAWEAVQVLLSHLNAKDRTIITLLDLEERGVRETARLTGWSESNVKVRAHRARKKMKTIFEELGMES
ncbi:RNA polymerase sigma factor [Verrucomicrobiales bacterium]|jgi:RNA polymerase sigma-70 factor (ECF subfamily)|nr:RNA polymerase sigma factor [Verrucomicrobiales bacterium]MDB3940252.1 RNA polymerase sigma factor [Verrucomicrobiales bacterium]